MITTNILSCGGLSVVASPRRTSSSRDTLSSVGGVLRWFREHLEMSKAPPVGEAFTCSLLYSVSVGSEAGGLESSSAREYEVTR